MKLRALEGVEQHGIVFLDEIDKVCRRSDHTSGADVSREGVQRDLLPLVEGCAISTKHGVVRTDHMALSTEDFMRILTEPDDSLTEQYKALLATEGVNLEFTEDGIRRIAEVAWQVNERTENIGARRLHTVLERLLEDVSFNAAEMDRVTVTIDAAYVDRNLSELAANEDLSRYIL